MENTNNFKMDDLKNSKQFQETVKVAVQKAVADYFEGKPLEKQQKPRQCRWARWREEKKQQQIQPDLVSGPDFGRHGPSPFWFHYMNHHFEQHPNHHYAHHHHHYGPWCWNQGSSYRKPDNFSKFCEPSHLFDFTE